MRFRNNMGHLLGLNFRRDIITFANNTGINRKIILNAFKDYIWKHYFHMVIRSHQIHLYYMG